jgi:hypothetical protein
MKTKPNVGEKAHYPGIVKRKGKVRPVTRTGVVREIVGDQFAIAGKDGSTVRVAADLVTAQ